MLPITANLMTISYRDSDPQVAKNVVQSLLTIFAEKTAGSSRTEMDSAQHFLDEEIASYRDQLRAAEMRRADLARQYPDIISDRSPDAPASAGDTDTRLDQARNAVVKARNDLADAVTKRDSLRKQLASIPPMLTVERSPQVIVTGGRALSPDAARLEQLRARLNSLRLKYTDQHPDVIAAKAEIAELEAEIETLRRRLGRRRRPGQDGDSQHCLRPAQSQPGRRRGQCRLGAADPGCRRERGQPPRTDRAVGAERVGPGAGSRPRLWRAKEKLSGAGGAPRIGADRRECRHQDPKDPVPHCRSASVAAVSGRTQPADAGIGGAAVRDRRRACRDRW